MYDVEEINCFFKLTLLDFRSIMPWLKFPESFTFFFLNPSPPCKIQFCIPKIPLFLLYPLEICTGGDGLWFFWKNHQGSDLSYYICLWYDKDIDHHIYLICKRFKKFKNNQQKKKKLFAIFDEFLIKPKKHFQYIQYSLSLTNFFCHLRFNRFLLYLLIIMKIY